MRAVKMGCLSLFFLSSCFPMIANAQTGMITGRVVSEDGAGLPNVSVYLNPIASSRRAASRDLSETVATDKEGNFRFTGLAEGLYTVNASSAKGYIPRPIPAAERIARGPYRTGDHVNFTMVRGGVITGRVMTANGEPMIGVQVSAMIVKDFEGNTRQMVLGGRPRLTDDRGVYRIYGLAPGTYVVFTRGNMAGSPVSAYEGYAPTYHPSSTRETAAEVTVTTGAEASGIHIRYRGERGYTVSGAVISATPAPPNFATTVALYNVSTGFQAGTGYARPGDVRSPFAIFGVTDGEYEVTVRRFVEETEDFLFSSRRVTIKGADVGGIALKLAPMASVSGKVVVETSPATCEGERKSPLEDVVVSARRDTPLPQALSLFKPSQYAASMNPNGEFTIKNIDPGRYFIIARSLGENWYAKSIAVSAAPAGRRSASLLTPIDAARNGLALKSSDRMSGLVMTVAGGAASLRGRLAPENEGSRLPAKMIVHLVPAETDSADAVLRYYEAVAGKEGEFDFKNVAPGKYRLIARAAPDDAPTYSPATPVAWGANERAKLRKEAEALKIEVELKPCQRLSDQVVKYR